MNKKYTVDDFYLLTVLGKGPYGKVFLVREVETQQVFALKVLKKKLIEKKDKAHYVFSERNLLVEVRTGTLSCNTPSSSTCTPPSRTRRSSTSSCSTVRAESCSRCWPGRRASPKSSTSLLTQSQVLRRADRAGPRVHAQEQRRVPRVRLLLVSLKPENILIDREGYIRFTDFGLSKKSKEESKDKYSLVGTPEYLPPEILLNEESDKAIDFWAFGTVVLKQAPYLTRCSPASLPSTARTLTSSSR